jgi:hypothetical protein
LKEGKDSRLFMKRISSIVFIACFFAKGLAQITTTQLLDGKVLNPITTAVPFLLIGPDSKQGAMGDVGAATDPDINSIHWNGSKLAFAEKRFGAGFTVTPWLRLLVPDINLYYLSGYAKISKRQAIGTSLRYFSLGSIQLTDVNGQSIGQYTPNEFAWDIAFSQQLSKNFSMGVAGRFINSGISRAFTGTNQGNPASTVAVDLSGYYKSNTFKMGSKKGTATAGFAFTNIGNKIRYSARRDFIPMNMRLGGGLKTEIDDYNTFGFYLDFNKLLVPTNPRYAYVKDANGQPTTSLQIDPATNAPIIEAGKDPNVPVVQGIFQSFGDAPDGPREELQEINISTGVEYWYNKTFAVRAGYFYEPKTKGARQYFSMGMGVRYSVINIDGSYLIPVTINNPLQRTWRISLSFEFDASGKNKTENPAASDPNQP